MATKTNRLKRSTAKKQDYLKQYKSRIARGDKSTPSYAQWASASSNERGLMQAGVGNKKLRRLKGK